MDKLLGKINEVIVNPLIFIAISIAFVVFIWGIVDFLRNRNSPEERKKGFSHMIWGVIGLAIMISFKGIIAMIINFLNLGS